MKEANPRGERHVSNYSLIGADVFYLGGGHLGEQH